jgi:hypothetical protein
MSNYRVRPYIKIWCDEWPDGYRMGAQEYSDYGIFIHLLLELTRTARPGHFEDADGNAMSVEHVARLLPGNPVDAVRRIVDRNVLKTGKGGVLYSPEMLAEFRMREANRRKIRRGIHGAIGTPTEITEHVRRMVGAGIDITEGQYKALRQMHKGTDWGVVVDDVIAAHHSGEVENVCGWIAERAER